MPYTLTTTTKKLARQRQRIRFVAGGTSAGKTISILQLLIDDANTDYFCKQCGAMSYTKPGCNNTTHKSYYDPRPTLTSVVSESFPHLRKGAMRDFMAMMQQHGYWRDSRWSKTEYTYTFESGSKLEFFSADQPSKVRGPRRDRLFMNEANNIPYEAWDQLLVRTKEYAWADWNPTAEFWAYTEVMPYREDYNFLTVTYKDNEGLDENIVKDIEAHKPNKAWWKVYGMGQLGETEGRIFTDWAIVDEIPHEAQLMVRGMDFGYSIDPTVLVDIYYYNGGYIVDELVYRTNYLDTDLGVFITNYKNPNTLIVGDSADKQKLVILQNMGIPIIGVEKKGSNGDTFTNSAIKYVQGQRMSITKRSVNVIKSYRNFMWQTDSEGNIRTNPSKYDHWQSDGMMAVIYGMTNFNLVDRREKEEAEPYMTGSLSSLWGR